MTSEHTHQKESHDGGMTTAQKKTMFDYGSYAPLAMIVTTLGGQDPDIALAWCSLRRQGGAVAPVGRSSKTGKFGVANCYLKASTGRIIIRVYQTDWIAIATMHLFFKEILWLLYMLFFLPCTMLL